MLWRRWWQADDGEEVGKSFIPLDAVGGGIAIDSLVQAALLILSLSYSFQLSLLRLMTSYKPATSDLSGERLASDPELLLSWEVVPRCDSFHDTY